MASRALVLSLTFAFLIAGACLAPVSEATPSGGAELIFYHCYTDSGLITIYEFYAKAGDATVNDVELCCFVDDDPVEVISCSVPASWYCHFETASYCVHFFSEDNPIPPGQTYGPFDVWVNPDYCFPVLTVVWSMTYNDTIVAGPDTTYWACGPTATEPSTWGTIKALYR